MLTCKERCLVFEKSGIQEYPACFLGALVCGTVRALATAVSTLVFTYGEFSYPGF